MKVQVKGDGVVLLSSLSVVSPSQLYISYLDGLRRLACTLTLTQVETMLLFVLYKIFLRVLYIESWRPPLCPAVQDFCLAAEYFCLSVHSCSLFCRNVKRHHL